MGVTKNGPFVARWSGKALSVSGKIRSGQTLNIGGTRTPNGIRFSVSVTGSGTGPLRPVSTRLANDAFDDVNRGTVRFNHAPTTVAKPISRN